MKTSKAKVSIESVRVRLATLGHSEDYAEYVRDVINAKPNKAERYAALRDAEYIGELIEETREVTEAYGWIDTDVGGSFSLEGDYFVRSFPVVHGPSFSIGDLSEHLKGLKVVSIGYEEIGDEAHNLINGKVYDSPAKVNAFFGL